jgi:hypothetical protein
MSFIYVCMYLSVTRGFRIPNFSFFFSLQRQILLYTHILSVSLSNLLTSSPCSFRVMLTAYLRTNLLPLKLYVCTARNQKSGTYPPENKLCILFLPPFPSTCSPTSTVSRHSPSSLYFSFLFFASSWPSGRVLFYAFRFQILLFSLYQFDQATVVRRLTFFLSSQGGPTEDGP